MVLHTYLSSLIGGGLAGLVVDASLFPLDTLKTRLQSPQGFRCAGGFTGVYKGIGPQLLGSAPQAALFFCTYEWSKGSLCHVVPSHCLPIVHMLSASVAEVVACVVRVPMDVVKQRRQTSNLNAFEITASAYRAEGFRGLYRGFNSTLIREIPFSFIQLPLLEQFKLIYSKHLMDGNELNSYQVANCGAMAGGIAAAITTPLDVVKTRITLAERNCGLSYAKVMASIYRSDGLAGFFAGLMPRVIWITVGGYIFFGTYDYAKSLASNVLS